MKKTKSFFKRLKGISSVLVVTAAVFFSGHGKNTKNNNNDARIYTQYYNDTNKSSISHSIHIVDPNYESIENNDYLINNISFNEVISESNDNMIPSFVDDDVNSEFINEVTAESNDDMIPSFVDEQYTIEESEFIEDTEIIQETSNNVTITFLEDLANYYGEELIYNANSNFVNDALNLVHDINKDNISNSYKYTYVTNLFNLSKEQLFATYQFIYELKVSFPQLSDKEIFCNFLACVFQKDKLDNIFISYARINHLSDSMMQNIVNNFCDSYILEITKDELMIKMMDALYYKLFYGISEEFMIDTILKEQDITLEQFDVVISSALCEAVPGSNIDVWCVIDTGLNRKQSKQFIKSAEKEFGEGKGNNIYYQFIKSGQFDVYTQGYYLRYYGKDKHDIPNYMAAVNALFRPTLIILDCLEFRGNGSSGSANNFEPVYRGNNYRHYFEEEDRIPIEEQDNYFVPKEDIARIRK